MFSRFTVSTDSKDTELGSSNQEASPSAGKNTGVVLLPCSCMEVCPYRYFLRVDISEIPGCQLLHLFFIKNSLKKVALKLVPGPL